MVLARAAHNGRTCAGSRPCKRRSSGGLSDSERFPQGGLHRALASPQNNSKPHVQYSTTGTKPVQRAGALRSSPEEPGPGRLHLALGGWRLTRAPAAIADTAATAFPLIGLRSQMSVSVLSQLHVFRTVPSRAHSSAARQLSIRLRRSRSNTITKYSLPGATRLSLDPNAAGRLFEYRLKRVNGVLQWVLRPVYTLAYWIQRLIRRIRAGRDFQINSSWTVRGPGNSDPSGPNSAPYAVSLRFLPFGNVWPDV